MLLTLLECVVAGFLTIVIYKLLNGGISTRGMLSTDGSGGVDPERVQALVIFFISVTVYATNTLHANAAGIKLAALPDVPTGLIGASFGSQVLYLGGKFLRMNRKG